jgi:hypothetical protein
MEGKPKRQTLWDKKNNIDPEKFNPYMVETNPHAIKASCELCISLPCCPEHCCDVSS